MDIYNCPQHLRKIYFQTVYYRYIHIIQIPTNKGVNSYKLKFPELNISHGIVAQFDDN